MPGIGRLTAAGACALLAACSGGGPKTASPTATSRPVETVIATVTATPTPIPERGTPWSLGAPLQLGSASGQLDLELYIEQGCTGCDGPPTALERVSRAPDGELRREILFKQPPGSKYMTSTAVAPDGTLYATACFGDCAEVGGFVSDGYTIVYTSNDGGATWSESPRSPAARKIWLHGVLPDSQVLLWVNVGETIDNLVFVKYPSGEPLISPQKGLFPVVTANPASAVLWQGPQGGPLYREDGSTVAVPAVAVTGAGAYVPRAWGAQPGDRLLMEWGDSRSGRLVFHLASVASGAALAEFRSTESVGYVEAGAWFDDHRALGDINYSTPALIDFATGEVRPIEIYGPLSNEDAYRGRNKIIGWRAPR